MLRGGGDAAWGKEPAGGVDGVGTLPPQLPGENVPWPLGAASAPVVAAAAAGCSYLTAGDGAVAAAVAAVASAAGGLEYAAAWMLMNVEQSHAAGVG